MLDFPRIQLFLCSIFCLVLILISVRKWKWKHTLIAAALTCGVVINLTFLIYYTSLVKVAVPWAESMKNDDGQLSILLTNVQMSNDRAEPLLELINDRSPDLVLAMEVNERWDHELTRLATEYPYSHKAVNEFAYGMVLYSKLPLKEKRIMYLNNDNVPSFECELTLVNGKEIALYCLHPVPPTHYKHLPDNAGQEETAMQKIGREVKAQGLPVLVAGDLNDVVWSRVDDLTHTENILFDIRVGRGFYNSYSAKNFMMKWPLDHILVTKEFRLRQLERLPNIGSDHFPMYAELIL